MTSAAYDTISGPQWLMELHRRLEAQALEVKQPWCPQQPHPKQRAFLDGAALEGLYGGAAGGGKSSCLLMGGLEDVDQPGYAALILRRTYKDLALPGAIMDRAGEWLRPTAARWDEQNKQWHFPSGARLQFGYLESDNDVFRYQSAEFQYIAFDELTQFSEKQYRYMLSRLRRSANQKVRLRVRSASNPGGRGHDWVKGRFVDPETRDPDTFFIPALLEDNPSLDQESYRRALEKLDSTTRAQLEHGQWIRDDHGLVYRYDDRLNGIDNFPNLYDPIFVLGIDLGASQSKPTTAFCIWAYSRTDPEQVVCVESDKAAGLIPSTIADSINRYRARYGITRIVADAGALGAGYVEEFRRRHIIPVEPAQKTDKLGFRKLINGDMERGTAKFIRSTNKDLIAEMQRLAWDEKGQDCEKGQEDHQTDSMLYSWREARYWQAKKPVEIPKRGTPERAAWEEDKIKRHLMKKSEKRGASHDFLLSD